MGIGAKDIDENEKRIRGALKSKRGFAKRRMRPGWSRICKMQEGKDEARQGLCGLRLRGLPDPVHKGSASLL
jgi:hypothetical protein